MTLFPVLGIVTGALGVFWDAAEVIPIHRMHDPGNPLSFSGTQDLT